MGIYLGEKERAVTSLEKAFEQVDWLAELRIGEANLPGMAIAITDRDKALKVASSYGPLHCFRSSL